MTQTSGQILFSKDTLLQNYLKNTINQLHDCWGNPLVFTISLAKSSSPKFPFLKDDVYPTASCKMICADLKVSKK